MLLIDIQIFYEESVPVVDHAVMIAMQRGIDPEKLILV